MGILFYNYKHKQPISFEKNYKHRDIEIVGRLGIQNQDQIRRPRKSQHLKREVTHNKIVFQRQQETCTLIV